MIASPLDAFLQATVRTATPLLLAALGEMAVERAGLINIGLEGIIVSGAFAALVAAVHLGPVAGYLAAAAAGLAMAGLFALFTIFLKSNQIITGTALTLLGLGMTGVLYRSTFGVPGAEATIILSATGSSGLESVPILGAVVFAQPTITQLLYLIVPALWLLIYRTHAGLALRAVGENQEAAIAAGIRPRRVQCAAVLFGGIMGGLAGGTLVLVQVGTFAEGMSAGRGFVAIAVVALGRWHPLGITLAALLFGAASALQFVLQAMGWTFPYQLFLIVPYVLTLATLAWTRGHSVAPAGLSRGEFAR